MIWIVLIIFIAALLQGVMGFGFALVAMPLLALMLPPSSGAALVALGGMVLASLMLYQYRKDVHFGEAAGLIASAALGVPIGIFILAHAPREPLLIGLGVLIAAFSLYSLTRPPAKELKDRRWRFAAGFIGGVLGGTYNIPGPPVILYGAMRRWSPARFLGVTQAFFLPLAVMIGAGHALAGFWTREVLTLFAASLPAIIAASFLGRRIAAKLSAAAPSKGVYGLCFVLGVVIVVTGLRA